jgi:hypothetical protein
MHARQLAARGMWPLQLRLCAAGLDVGMVVVRLSSSPRLQGQLYEGGAGGPIWMIRPL